jgi:oxygen-independent coproporphyrinogen-3 oxidase
MPVGIYISVPFCRTKCSYCNFASDVFSKSAYENYVGRVVEDIADSRRLAAELGCEFDATADSIYLGGGTPSILDAGQLQRIFSAVRDHFEVTPDAEITVECAPGTLTPQMIETLLKCGVNRVSLGVQSFVDEEAQSVGRLHKRSTVIEEISRLREAGLVNINIDLIAGLPHQTAESWAFSVSEAIATGVPHVSVYMLEVDDDSRLGRELIAGGARYHAHFVPDDDATADFYQRACEMLAGAGIEQYEISNFARISPGLQSKSLHNLKYWTRQPYLGFGVDAHSMLEKIPVGTAALGCPTVSVAVRIAIPDSLDGYMNRETPVVTPISAQAEIEEIFFLGLRLNDGVDLNRIRQERICQERHREGNGLREEHDFSRATSATENAALAADANDDSIAMWEPAIQQCLDDGLLEQHGTIIRLTARGRLLSNEVFARFLVEETEVKVGSGHVNPR